MLKLKLSWGRFGSGLCVCVHDRVRRVAGRFTCWRHFNLHGEVCEQRGWGRECRQAMRCNVEEMRGVRGEERRSMREEVRRGGERLREKKKR